MAEKTKNLIHSETELKLVIASESPRSLYEEIGKIRTIAGCEFEALPHLFLHDRYFDTAAGDFRAAQWALRLRTTPGGHVIAMKGPAVMNEYGALERPEIEAEWSRDALHEMALHAKAIGIKLPISGAFSNDRDPVETLHAPGLVTIQDRETERRVRHVLAGNNKPIVEMVLDHVKYRAGERTISHYEIELESMSSESENAIPQISNELLQIYGDALRRWRHDKLTLGWAIERLLNESGASRLISDDGLTSSAYDRLDDLLSQR